MTPLRPYAIPPASGDRPLPRDAEAWTDMAAELMPLLNDVIVATQECRFHDAHLNEDGEWSCDLIDGPVSALLAWAEGKL